VPNIRIKKNELSKLVKLLVGQIITALGVSSGSLKKNLEIKIMLYMIKQFDNNQNVGFEYI
jgi:hypothetical protein